MGDPKKSRKKWQGPSHPWRKETLLEEMQLVGEYGLRNKKELWIARSFIREIRAKARRLLALPPEERTMFEEPLISRLYKLGLVPSGEASLDDVLSLTVRDVLERRLQTIVYRKGLAKTIRQARQLITHGHIAVNSRRVRSPGYLVTRDEENFVTYYEGSPLARQVQAGA